MFYANNGASQLVLNAKNYRFNRRYSYNRYPGSKPLLSKDKLILFSNVAKKRHDSKNGQPERFRQNLAMASWSAPTGLPVNGTGDKEGTAFGTSSNITDPGYDGVVIHNKPTTNIHVTENSDVDINIDKGQLLDDAAKLVADAAHLTKNLRPCSHSDKKTDENKCEETTEEQAKDDDSNFILNTWMLTVISQILTLKILVSILTKILSEWCFWSVCNGRRFWGAAIAVDTKPLHEDDVNPEKNKRRRFC